MPPLTPGQDALKRAKAYPLSDDDLRRVLGPSIRILNYPDLKGLEHADEMFDDKGRCILLFPNNGPSSGHWTCLIRRKDGIYFFDPYGDKPDTKQKRGITAEEKVEWGVDRPDLTRLLKGSGSPVFYNAKAFQSSSPNVADCGRHCASRLLYAPLSLAEYNRIIVQSGMSPDEFVVGLVASKLGK